MLHFIAVENNVVQHAQQVAESNGSVLHEFPGLTWCRIGREAESKLLLENEKKQVFQFRASDVAQNYV